MILLVAALLQADPVLVGDFAGSGEVPTPWQVVRLGRAKPTAYRISKIADVPAVEASVDRSMALLVRPIAIDLSQTPMLCWRWYIEGVVANADMNTKRGNDFAARLYVGFDVTDAAMSAGTKLKLSFARAIYGRAIPDAALTYVWDNKHPVGTTRKSPHTNRQEIIVAQSGNGLARRWVAQRADVAADFGRGFAGERGTVVQLAIASDGDNTRSTFQAAYAGIHFVRRDEACRV